MSTFEERLLAKVDRTPGHGPNGDCWLWTAYKNNGGYGRINRDGRMVLAHRAASEIAYGPIPEGLFVCHKCDNPACVRPDHLWLGTHDDNMYDMAAKGRCLAQAHPERVARGDRSGSRLHPERLARGERHWRAKLDADKVRAIRAAAGTQAAIAAQFGVSFQQVSDIRSRKYWRHVCLQ